ncbi:uncharacterized protein LOC119111729 [Pollicipes pollicipes]|uniref:uncharacterized protein LOC119111729 n=1 Tax=Pollicipes pollicipes TaxID=41117 RepID=UPI0018850A1D|nr:uncharacterized protein LOC119111729 [Pollicipes pollicipes]
MMRNTAAADGYSFRLDADSSSTYSDASTTERSSIYKRRIDSLFREKRSAGGSDAAAASNSDYEVMEMAPEQRSQQFQDVRSAVQAQIEKMFQSQEVGRSASAGVKFKVDYLGALAIEDKATRLEDLQFPLKRLYMEYRILQKRGKTPLPGTLEITDTGVRVQYVRELHKGVQEVFNPFQTIAVWAAVKFVAKKQVNPSGQMELKFAFLPLICDPESQEKFTLYNDLQMDLITEAVGVSHPPVFACVMRKPGLVKTLECHGFVCGAPEDAIVIAANLYQALLSSMRTEPAAGSPRLDTSNGSNSSVDTAADDASDRHGVVVDDFSGGRLPRSRSFAELNGRLDIKQLLAQIQARDGIRTVDDVLRQVVNPGGMSFSDLRPEHRELLLRLALTLSKDEMYQRSKHIMKKQSKKLSSVGESDTDGSTISNVLKATKKSLSRFSSRSGSFQSPSSYLRERTPLKKLYNVRASEKKLGVRSDGEVTVRALRSVSGARDEAKSPPSRLSSSSSSVYSSKCYCTLPRGAGGLTKAKSTYDLPCACDTESCAESEKCYCSLKRVSKSGLKVYQIKLDSESESTDGAARSTLGRGRRREYGSLGNLSRADSPSTAWRKNAASLQSGGSRDSAALRRGRSSSSLLTSSTGVMGDKSGGAVYAEEAAVARRRSRSRSLALSLDSDGSARDPQSARAGRKSFSIDNLHHSANGFIFNRMSSTSSMSTTSNRSSQSAGSGGRFLLVSAADPSGKIVYRGASQRQPSRNGGDIMSMKKTTEIAATFSGLKLNQTTDLLGTESEDDAYSSMQNVSGSNTARSRHGYSDQNIENSLGYLP